jgi:hypothetical protein
VARVRSDEVGWFPAQGSYEESVLSWHEQIDESFRRRNLEAQRTGSEMRSRLRTDAQTTGIVAD